MNCDKGDSDRHWLLCQGHMVANSNQSGNNVRVGGEEKKEEKLALRQELKRTEKCWAEAVRIMHTANWMEERMSRFEKWVGFTFGL